MGGAVSAKHAHLHRKHSWARLRERAARVVFLTTREPADDLTTLLWCMLVPSLTGLLLAVLLHLWRGLVG
jgi:hypothetical protein